MNRNVGPSLWDIPGNVTTMTTMWQEGASATEIAQALGQGATRNSVLSKVRRSGLAKRDTSIRPHNKGKPKAGLAFSIARARKQAEGGATPPSAVEAILGKGSQGAERFVEAVETIVDDGPLISLLELTEHTCKWPIGDPKKEGFGFCGAIPMDGKPYCDKHHQRSLGNLRGSVGAQ